jgi:hypothetical protein
MARTSAGADLERLLDERGDQLMRAARLLQPRADLPCDAHHEPGGSRHSDGRLGLAAVISPEAAGLLRDLGGCVLDRRL